MKKNIVFALLVVLGMFASCSKETINSKPVQYVGSDIVYGNSVFIIDAVNSLYTYVPGGYNRLGGNSMVASATDEAVHATRNSEAELWGTGAWGTTLSTVRDDAFAKSYAGIRATYVYTEEIDPNIIDGVMSKADRDANYGQVIFIRALLNFELLKRYGGYPIVKHKLKADEELNIPKSSYDECVQYISDLCDEAQAVLKVTYPAAGDFGRATAGAAMALKARLLLYAASPLNNPSNDVSKWQAAAAASAAVINLESGGGKVYDLYSGGYDAFFNALAGNREIIFSKIETNSNTYERLNGPVSITGGEGGTNPTLDLVNAYEMIDGTPFNWNNPAHAADPFAGRDPRFAKSILFNGAKWMNDMTIETFEGGKDKIGNKATRTGFYLRKFLSINAPWNAPVGTANHSFPLFRYGEVLLNYAEAMNEAYGPDDPATYGMTARQAIALIRTRAGLTDNQTVPLAVDQAAMREAIRHERRIELAFEEHRQQDLRRWKTAEQVLNEPVHGLKIVKNGDDTFTYTPEVVEQREFQSKMYLYPFPQGEISRNSGLVQNTGW